MKEKTADVNVCHKWKPVPVWQEEHGGGVFAVKRSVDWVIRRYKDRLVKAGVLILGRGRTPTLLGPDFGEVALAILAEESMNQLAEDAAA